ncbi:MAG: 2,3-bisphosphoglycerate-independent phosphoglycerate mutase [Clostridia bacterium]|nr:2,3-bisphosphoglycerate-independent phosphoglycerate mutase [Clostridia bacterium]
MKDKQYMLMILDGVGLNDDETGNAFKLASTPNIDRLVARYPNAYLKTSGLSVGLPEGQMGNSEVGHTTIGSGRVVYQDLTQITEKIKSGEFFKNKVLLDAVEHVKRNDSKLHIFGLLSDGGVHSHTEHIFALLELAKREGVEQVYVHAFMDGRDTSPTSGVDYIRSLENKCKELGIGRLSTIMGRFYAMDRDKRWDRVEAAYNAMTLGEGKHFKTAERAVENSYECQEFDEFIKPIVIVNDEEKPIGLVESKDAVIFANFRPDRAREISHAFTDNAFTGFVRKSGKLSSLRYVSMTEYDETLENVKVAYKKEEIKETLGEFLSKRGYTQLRIAETEKYAHVTFFFNGGEEKEYNGESRILVPSPKVATYDLKPEMSAYEVTDKLIEAMESKQHDVIVINYANGDMVGHTGNLDAAIQAVEALDKCVGRVMDKLVELGGEAIIIADHGNCEQMIDSNTGEALTSHTTFDVPVIVVSDRVRAIEPGSLADVAPTLIDLMGLNKPKEMTGSSIVKIEKE